MDAWRELDLVGQLANLAFACEASSGHIFKFSMSRSFMNHLFSASLRRTLHPR